MKPRRAMRIALGITALLLAAAASTAFYIEWARGAENEGIILANQVEQIDSLRACLHDPGAAATLGSMLDYSSVYRIQTDNTSEGHRHTFYFAGRQRNTARASTVTIGTVRDSGSGFGYKVLPPSHGFSELQAQRHRQIVDGEGLRVLREGLDNASVFGSLKSFVETQAVRTLCIAQNDTGIEWELTFTSARPGETGTERLWHARFDGSQQRYIFYD